MLLRSILEKHVSLQEGEQHLLPRTRENVFTGSYAGRVKITEATQVANNEPASRKAYPHKLKVTRTANDGSERFHSSYANSEPFTDVLDDIRKPAVLARANRIEKIARRVKAAAGGVAVAGLVTLIVLAGGNESDSPTQPDATIESCAQVVDGSETLIPIEDTLARTLQKAGQTVCSLANTDYLVSTSPTAG